MTYRSSPIKRYRRTKAEVNDLKLKLYTLVEANHPMTVRQVFYRAVSAGLIDKSEAEYKNTIVRLLGAMRRGYEMPFGWIADNTRWMRKPDSFESLAEALEATKNTYRRALWSNQHSYVEVWLEKDALSGVVMDVTAKWDVPLMVTRGYPSLSFLHSAAMAIAEQRKPAYLYYLGDHDPSGEDIPRKVESDLRKFAPRAEIHFERLAVNRRQIEKWNLPTRPTKRSDSRSKGFEGESVEVDAIEPRQLRELVEQAIERHVDEHALHQLRAAEQAELLTLDAIVSRGFLQ